MANILTALRLLLAVPFAWGLADPTLLAPALLLTLLMVAIATDLLDGIVARRMHSDSARGQLFDHSTDCFFVTAGLSGAAIAGSVHPLLPLLVAVAFIQYVLDSYYLGRHKRLRMNLLGRFNGVLYFVPLILLALVQQSWMTASEAFLYRLNEVFVYGLMVSTLLSMIDRALAPWRGGHAREGAE